MSLFCWLKTATLLKLTLLYGCFSLSKKRVLVSRKATVSWHVRMCASRCWTRPVLGKQYIKDIKFPFVKAPILKNFFVTLKPATLTLHHRCSSRSLNCINGTKSNNASHIHCQLSGSSNLIFMECHWWSQAQHFIWWKLVFRTSLLFQSVI